MATATTRLNFVLPASVVTDLAIISHETGMPRGEIVRHALELLKQARQAKADGMGFGIVADRNALHCEIALAI